MTGAFATLDAMQRVDLGRALAGFGAALSALWFIVLYSMPIRLTHTDTHASILSSKRGERR